MNLSWKDDTSATTTSTSSAPGGEHRGHQGRDGGLPVGAGHRHQRQPPPGGGAGQLDLGAERHTGPPGQAVDRVALRHAGARHDEVGGGDERGKLLGGGGAHHGHAEGGEGGGPLGKAGAGWIVVDNRHRAIGGEAAGDRLAGHPEADHECVSTQTSCSLDPTWNEV